MTFKKTIPALVACFALGGAGAALAQSGQQNTSGAVGAGAAATTPQGASAGGMAAGSSANRSWDHRADKQQNRQERRAEQRAKTPHANSASTYGSGAVTTTRDSANVGVTTGGAASGAGANRAGSTIDAYGETTRQGSNADLYGDSAAQSGEKPAN
jgi:hypothetical protein